MADATPETAVEVAAGEISAEAAAGKPEAVVRPKPNPGGRKTRLKQLPGYTRSLLRIKVPVVVTLAEKRQAFSRIVELGAGSMIQFNKSCEKTLDLSVGGHRIAAGEAVKVGDKFGLRITSIVLPDERFQPVKAGMTTRE